MKWVLVPKLTVISVSHFFSEQKVKNKNVSNPVFWNFLFHVLYVIPFRFKQWNGIFSLKEAAEFLST